MFHLYTLILFLYILWRFVAVLPTSKKTKVLIGSAIFIISKYHYWLQAIYGSPFAAELPRWLLVFLGVGFCAFLLFAVILFLTDVFYLVFRVLSWKRAKPETTQRILFVSRYFACFTAISLAILGSYQALRVPKVKHLTLEISGLPAAFVDFKLVQLTDLHLTPIFPPKWSNEVVKRTNAVNPDLILITGDLIDGTPTQRENEVEPLRRLKAKHGVMASLGNHEYYFDANAWKAKFESLGINVLVNEHQLITRYDESDSNIELANEDSAAIAIVGLPDTSALRFGLPAPDLALATKGLSTDIPVILMNHRPSGAKKYTAKGVDLQLSGHTHGGMFKGLNRLVASHNEGYVSGLYDVDGMHLYVNNGTGLWGGFPIRLGVSSEITVITLKQKLN